MLIHCRYCIACEGERPIQTAEARFFSEVDTGQIPVFVVFTKYDKLIRSHLNDWEDENEDSKLNKSQREAIVEDPTFASFEKDFKGPLLAVAKRRTHIQICRTAVQKYHEVKLQKHNSKGTSTSFTNHFLAQRCYYQMLKTFCSLQLQCRVHPLWRSVIRCIFRTQIYHSQPDLLMELFAGSTLS